MLLRRLVFVAVVALFGNVNSSLPADELDALFVRAVEYVQSLPKDESDQLSKAEKMDMYANYKQATLGPLTENDVPAPSFFSITERFKYAVWAALGDKSRAQSKEDYIANLDRVSPGWRED